MEESSEPKSPKRHQSSKLINLLKGTISLAIGITTTYVFYKITSSEVIVRDPLVESLSWGAISTTFSGAYFYYLS